MIRRSSSVLVTFLLAGSVHSGSALADQQFCSRYAKHATGQVSMNVDLKCGFTGPRWSTDEKFHFGRCLDDLKANITNPQGYQAAKNHFDAEDRQRINDVIACRDQKAAAEPPPPVVEDAETPDPIDAGGGAPDPVDAGGEAPDPVDAGGGAPEPGPVVGGGGKTARTVGQATDLYEAKEGKKIGGDGDFLRPGQQVTTVVPGCGNEWCELSDPKGWVWGGHLK